MLRLPGTPLQTCSAPMWAYFMLLVHLQIHGSQELQSRTSLPYVPASVYSFSNICQLLNSLLLQLYPVSYKKRERLITEEEKRKDMFSPQLNNDLSASKPSKELSIIHGAPSHSATSSFNVLSVGSCSTTNEKSSIIKGQLESVGLSIQDLICGVCEKLLYRPVILNCGHGLFVILQCIVKLVFSPDNVNPKCKVCWSAHPSGCIKVCLALEQLLEKQFTELYEDRKKVVVKQLHTENGTQSCSSTTQKHVDQLSSHSSSRRLQGVKVHYQVGCDYCGMFPIIGERYNCKDCRERAGFDLCESCYNTPPKVQGRCNQQHRPDHKLEIVQSSYFLSAEDDTTRYDDDTDAEEDNEEDINQGNTSGEDIDSTI